MAARVSPEPLAEAVAAETLPVPPVVVLLPDVPPVTVVVVPLTLPVLVVTLPVVC